MHNKNLQTESNTNNNELMKNYKVLYFDISGSIHESGHR